MKTNPVVHVITVFFSISHCMQPFQIQIARFDAERARRGRRARDQSLIRKCARMCSEADRRSIIELLNFEIFDYSNAISTSGVTVSAFMALRFFVRF